MGGGTIQLEDTLKRTELCTGAVYSIQEAVQQVKDESKAADTLKSRLDKKEKESDDALSTTDLDVTLSDSEIKIDYSPEEMFFGLNSTYNLFSDYLKAVATSTSLELYHAGDEDDKESADDNNSETLNDKEAEATMQDVCVAYVTGAKTDVDFVTRKKLTTWILFNSALFRLYESEALTRDVNYTEM